MLCPTQLARVQSGLSDTFFELAKDAKDASYVQQIFMALMDASVRTLCEDLNAWNANHDSYLPDELLAACFEYLPLADRIKSSSVSRRWRNVAVSFPAVWASIEVSATNRHAIPLLNLLLSRTGTHPVDLKYIAGRSTGIGPIGEAAKAISHHMHHIRSIEWCGGLEDICFSKDAPMLETLHCREGGIIRESFLGGTIGALRDLVVGGKLTIAQGETPIALASVQSLVVKSSISVRDTNRLFAALNRLEVLHLYQVLPSPADLSPCVPLPQTLRRLHVKLYGQPDGHEAFFQMMTEWDIHRVPYVEMIEFPGRMCADMPQMLIEPRRVSGTDPATGRRRVVSCSDPSYMSSFVCDAVKFISNSDRKELSISTEALLLLAQRNTTLPESIRKLTIVPSVEDIHSRIGALKSMISPSTTLECVTCDIGCRKDVLGTLQVVAENFVRSTGRLLREIRVRNLPFDINAASSRLPTFCEQLALESSNLD